MPTLGEVLPLSNCPWCSHAALQVIRNMHCFYIQAISAIMRAAHLTRNQRKYRP